MPVTKKDLDCIDFSALQAKYHYTEINWSEFHNAQGIDHYKLLAYLSNFYKGRDIFDIGTHRGASALALSYTSENTVYSFDIEHNYRLPQVPNIQYNLEDLWDMSVRSKWEAKLLGSAFIFLDIDPHEGTRELEFYEWLKQKNYQGFVICDDIWYFKPMRDAFWYKIPSEDKLDVTEVGHWSGTGIVRFQPSELWPSRTVPNNWTVVTAYFDLTKKTDASQQIKERDRNHYLVNSIATLSLDQNMIIYCEPENEEFMRSLRPAWLLTKTQFVTMSFEDFPLTKYREQIIENRKQFPYKFDDRNTASYYLLCMSRYDMLKRTIEQNPFNSTHFAWLNICIERMGFTNLIELDNVFLQNRNKFSTCYIDYRAKELVENPPNYYRNGGLCSMCSGFFTGNSYYMKEFCNEVEKAFMDYLKVGYGHADEQLFSVVYFRKPELFDVYYGDYLQMVRNYVYVKEAPHSPLNLLIQNSFNHQDYVTCLKGCRTLIESINKGYVNLNEADTKRLMTMYIKCSMTISPL
jgi:hypothetical protein